MSNCKMLINPIFGQKYTENFNKINAMMRKEFYNLCMFFWILWLQSNGSTASLAYNA